MPAPRALAAIDMGASSTRLFAGAITGGALRLDELARVPTRPVRLPDGWHCDILGTFSAMLDGLARFSRQLGGAPVSVGVDGWGVDYGLLAPEGSLLAPPFHYRDPRSQEMPRRANELLGPNYLYQATGVQEMPINTVFQLMAEAGSTAYQVASTLLLLPDLLAYLLTGEARLELTNASTTQLLDARTSALVPDILQKLALRTDLFPPLAQPGHVLAPVLVPVAEAAGLSPGSHVVTVASHDTASAVLAVPATEDFAYVVSGTWSLVGLELAAPVITEASQAANFSNELGAEGTVRFLRNAMGHWALQECQRAWHAAGMADDISVLLEQAAGHPAFAAVFDTEEPELALPGDMPARVAAACRALGEPVPQSQAALVRCVVDSMALAIGDALDAAFACSGRSAQVLHVVGGGSANQLLLSSLAAVTGLPIVAGPVEASAVGNLLVQLQAAGLVGDRYQGRELVSRSFALTRTVPDPKLQKLAQAARARLPGSRRGRPAGTGPTAPRTG